MKKAKKVTIKLSRWMIFLAFLFLKECFDLPVRIPRKYKEALNNRIGRFQRQQVPAFNLFVPTVGKKAGNPLTKNGRQKAPAGAHIQGISRIKFLSQQRNWTK